MDFSWLDPSLRLTKRQVSTYVLVLTSSMYAQLLSVDNESDADIEQREQAIEQAIEWKASASYLLTPRVRPFVRDNIRCSYLPVRYYEGCCEQVHQL